MRIELLFFDGCPSYEALLPRLPALLTNAGVEEAEIDLVRVEDAHGAHTERF